MRRKGFLRRRAEAIAWRIKCRRWGICNFFEALCGVAALITVVGALTLYASMHHPVRNTEMMLGITGWATGAFVVLAAVSSRLRKWAINVRF